MEGNVLIAHHILNDLEDAEQQNENARRILYNKKDPFELSNEKFIKIFRLDKDLVRELIELLSPFVEAPSRASALTVKLKVLLALKFYAQGSYQESTGSTVYTAVSQPSASRAIHEITDALNRPEIFDQFVKFPANMAEITTRRQLFYNKYQFPEIVGIVDCTHVAITKPHWENYPEHIYVNRKHYHSINVQLICDENLKIINVNARFPGSTHDSFVWQQSNVSNVMEMISRRNENNPFFLLADSGYLLRPWIQTPLGQENTEAEIRYNARFKTIRSSIERCNGILKNRFRCLLKHRVLHYHPTMAAKIVNACVLLHNICINNNLPMPNEGLDFDFGIDVEDRPIPGVVAAINPDLVAGRRLQRHVIDTHFQN